MNGNSLLRISDLSKNEIMEILDEANDFGSRYMDWQLPEGNWLPIFFLSQVREHIFLFHQLKCSWGAK